MWYLQQQHLLLDMPWEFVSNQNIVLLQLGEIEKDLLSPAGHVLSWWNCPGGTRDVSYRDLIAPPCSPASAPRKVGSPYPHPPDWNVDSGCCWEHKEHQTLQQNLHLQGVKHRNVESLGGMGMMWESRILDPAFNYHA